MRTILERDTRKRGQQPRRSGARRSRAADDRERTRTHPLSALQRRHGNQAVQRLVERGSQSKLEVGEPNDRYEREADRVAGVVARATDPDRAKSRVARRLHQPAPIQREEAPVPAARSGSRSEFGSPGVGRPIPERERAFMERRFGAGFDDVRLHTGTAATEMSRELNAEAFTHGSDIYFRDRGFAPGPGSGRRLLAHELTHVIQQRSSAARRSVVQRSIQNAFNQYRGTCDCGRALANNCAHYLSDAFIRAGYDELDGGDGGLYREHNGRVVCEAGRPVRAREMRDWFSGRATESQDGEPDDDQYWAVFQHQPGGYWGGHVAIHRHNGTGYDSRGTGDYPDWETQEHYTW